MIKKKLLVSTLIIISMFSYLQAQNTQTQKAKEVAVAFFKMAFTNRQPVKAANMYIDENKYIQHNPEGKDGREDFINGYGKFVLETNYKAEIKRIIAQGDTVVIHSHGKVNPEDKNDRGEAVIDIFHIENNKIVEHWDVVQQVPEHSNNNNTMF
ncbi:ester cyclase [Campylobacterota bacterium DY0563]